MNFLNSYLRSKLDISNIGFQRGDREGGYFCTPMGANVIGWAGVDGIHFCTIKDFGEMIFSVSPTTYEPGHYVHPVAKNFEDFLRLLLATGDTAAIEQCWFMDREVFEEFLESNRPTPEMQACLDAIVKKYKLTPMEDPFGYIHELQDSFDDCQIPFSQEYYDTVGEPEEQVPPEWKVTWDGDFFQSDPDDEGAEPVTVNVWFQWAGIDWYVPEVYPFDRGVIIHLMGKVDPALVPTEDYSEFVSQEAWEKMQAENPLNLHARHELTINGLALRPSGSTGTTWMPNQDWNKETKWVLEHYGLDENAAWQIWRMKFYWPKVRMDIESMDMTMMQHPVSISGTHFKTPGEGESVTLTHPQTRAEYILTVQEVRQEKADFQSLRDQSMEYPTCYTQMQFRIDPPMTRNLFRIVDCTRSDQPRPKDGTQSSAAIGIIGGAHSVSSILKGQPEIHVANSALHFQPVAEVEWRIVFQEKPNADLTVSLI